jgi:hypothetical protein
MKNKRPFFFPFYLSLFLMYLFRLVSFGFMFYKTVASNDRDTRQHRPKVYFQR